MRPTSRQVDQGRVGVCQRQPPVPRWGVLAALAALALGSGCGAPAYRPVQLLGPGALNDSTVAMGSLVVGLRTGAEWVEFTVRNTGDAPLEIDWAAATLVEQGGAPHRLIEPHTVQEFHAEAGPRGAAEAWLTAAATEEHGVQVHRAPAWLDRLGRGSTQILAPGASDRRVFYPAEHIRSGWQGWQVVAPLFCRRDPRQGEFAIHLRYRTDGEWQDATIPGQVGGRHGREATALPGSMASPRR
jgi:hypothetical protein